MLLRKGNTKDITLTMQIYLKQSSQKFFECERIVQAERENDPSPNDRRARLEQTVAK